MSLPPAVATRLTDAPEVITPGASHQLTIIGLLESRLSDPISKAQHTISAVSADARIVDVLHCAAGSPILRIDRLFINTHGDPIVLSVGYFLPDQYTYRTQLRRSAPS